MKERHRIGFKNHDLVYTCIKLKAKRKVTAIDCKVIVV